eukprot:Ihof_evm1s105 gene=Ihof_evmTU1s105
MSLLGRGTVRAVCGARMGIMWLPTVTQLRFLNLHEYQSKELMEKFDIPIQKFCTVDNASDARAASAALAVSEYVVKAQIHAGGRGKGMFNNGFKGGVHLTSNPDEVESICRKMIGNRLVTKQTSADGVVVRKVMIAEALDIAKETYFAIVMDRGAQGPVLIASSEGGMDIEEVAEKTPNKIFKEVVDITKGVHQDQ